MEKEQRQKTDEAERYLHGELSAEEKRAFERRLPDDPELAQILEMIKETDRVLLDTEALEFRETLQDVYASYRTSRKAAIRLNRPVYRLIGIAAMVIVVIGLAFLVRRHTHSIPLNQAIVAAYYRPYHVPVDYRSPEGTLDATFRKAVEKYNEQQYKKAIHLFEQVLTQDKTRMDANLMDGLSNFEIKEYTRADSSFSRIIRHKDNLYFQQAQWYLGFCFLMTNQNKKAIVLYRKIISEKGYYMLKAEKILKKLASE